MPWGAVPPGAQANHLRAGSNRALHPNRRILDDDGAANVGADRGRCVEVNIGCRLSARDMLVAAEDVASEMVADPHMLEMPLDPADGAGRGDGARQVDRQGLEEFDRSRDSIETFGKDARILLGAGGVEILRNGTPDPPLYGRKEVASVEAHEMFERLLDAGRVADAGQIFRDLEVTRIFALQQNSVEIEDDGVEPQRRSPNSAVPTRMCVAPIVTAVSKSADIPMLSQGTPCRRASFASRAK